MLNHNHFAPEQITEKIAEIEHFSYPTNNLDINDTVSKDFDFLPAILENRRIVFWGEQLHDDGSAFQAKGKLIRYLHEHLNFNVVLYEAGLYDMYLLNSRIDSLNPQETPAIGLYDFWWNNDFCQPVWNYYRMEKEKNNPIQLGGFDVQFTGSMSSEERYDKLRNYLKTKEIDIDNYPILPANRTNLNSLTFKFFHEMRMSPSGKDSLLNAFSSITEILNTRKNCLEDEIYIRYLTGMKNRYKSVWQYNPGSLESMQIRDSLMAENLIWLIDSVYKNKKIIVWTANIHTFYDMIEKDFKPMGKYIKDKYGEKVYMMAFTSYARKNLYGKLKKKASNRSIESVFHQTRKQYFYLNTADCISGSFLKRESFSMMNQNMSETADWSQLIDGIFYIDTMHSITKSKK
jgi:erythromycin esterase-like protein